MERALEIQKEFNKAMITNTAQTLQMFQAFMEKIKYYSTFQLIGHIPLRGSSTAQGKATLGYKSNRLEVGVCQLLSARVFSTKRKNQEMLD